MIYYNKNGGPEQIFKYINGRHIRKKGEKNNQRDIQWTWTY